MARKFYLNTIMIQVLSEDEPIGDNASLENIEHEFTEGSMVAGELKIDRVEVTPQEAANRCSLFGSTPDFFQLDSEGKDLNE